MIIRITFEIWKEYYSQYISSQICNLKKNQRWRPILMKLLEIKIHKMIEKSKKKNNIGSRKFELQQRKEGEESPKMME